MQILRALRVAVMFSVFLLCVPRAFAQSVDLRGVVRDSASNAPVAGTVVLALDGVGNTLGRTITNARGQYRMAMPQGALLLRAIRIGYRAATERLPLTLAESVTLDLVIATLPQQLQTVQVAGARGCPVRADANAASALLEQARAGLLATVVARERNPARLVVLRYDRELDLDGIDVVSQSVRVDSSANATTSFNAVRNAVDFVNGGFRTGNAGEYTYYGPDADVLLDERFERGYCFSLAAADTAHRAKVGLHFAAAVKRNGRVDIDGTLWIDTAARALSDIEFRYIGIEALGESFQAGGRVSFATLPSGVPFIDRWSMRLVGANDNSGDRVSSQLYTISETGGELARAQWPDGDAWMGAQGTVHLTTVTNDGLPSKNAQINLAGTDYRGKTDSLGRVTFNFVLPGPYTVALDDATLAPIGLQLPVARSFVVRRGSATIARAILPTAVQYFAARCGTQVPTDKNTWVIARAFGSDGRALVGLHWRASIEDKGRWQVRYDNGLTGSDGLIIVCRNIALNTRVEVAVWRDPKDAIRVQRTMAELVNVVRIAVPTAAPIVATVKTGGNTDKLAPVTVMGTVRDSVTGALVSDARVTFVGTPFEGSTDLSGTFVVGGITPGTYTVELSTPALDSVGVVFHSTVSLAAQPDAINLFAPSHAAVLASACGSTDATGFVAGTVGTQSSLKIPVGMRVVAEWEEALPDSLKSASTAPAGSRTVWRHGDLSPGGAYRVCGVPAGTRVVLRTESDSATPLASRAQSLTLMADRRYARIDLQLDSTIASVTTLMGSVFADTAGAPLENVAVTLTDINRTVLTDRLGNFRVSDVPVGPHLLSVKRIGYSAYNAPVELVANRVEDVTVLMNRMSALTTVTVEADPSLKDFEERRKTGVGRYLTRGDLEKQRGRKLGDVVSQVGGFGSMARGAGHAWVVGKRAPSHILTAQIDSVAGFGKKSAPVLIAPADLRDQGLYCPTDAERHSGGIPECSCFAQVYMDGRLLNNSRPTEPFDANTLMTDEVEGVEFYATAASTPGRYASLNAQCGVMLIWTRRSGAPTARTGQP